MRAPQDAEQTPQEPCSNQAGARIGQSVEKPEATIDLRVAGFESNSRTSKAPHKSVTLERKHAGRKDNAGTNLIH